MCRIRIRPDQGRCVPDLHGPVTAGRDELSAIGTERHIADRAAMPAQGEDLLARLHVPDLDGPVIAGRGEALAIGMKNGLSNLADMAAEDLHLLAQSRDSRS